MEEMMTSPEASDRSEERSQHYGKAPSGTVTFLFTDIEGSTKLLKTLGKAYKTLLQDHRQILRELLRRWDGHEVDTQGDAFFFSFQRATQAVAACAEIQHALFSHPWPKQAEVKVRMGLHTGEPWDTDEGYVGMDVHRASRIAHAGYGGQVLISETTAALVMDDLPSGVSLLDLGSHVLKDMRRPEHIHQLVIEGLPCEFPPLKSMNVYPPDVSRASGLENLPPYLRAEGRIEDIRPVFVSRDVELEKLDFHLQKALSGEGSLVFITGEPGRGKTALMGEFSWRAAELHPDLVVARGNCNAYAGMGDPYLPFRDVLASLCGGIETQWSAGLLNREQAVRLWRILPEVARIIVDFAPDLIHRLIAGGGLLSRAQDHGGVPPELLGRLQVLTSQSSHPSIPRGLDQVALFEQFTSILGELSKHYPLLLFLDDLQWMDIGSANLLFHLGRRLVGSRILLLGAYRPEEVALGRDGGRHPLAELLAEFKRQYGDIWINLDGIDSSREQLFVEELLKIQPNVLSKSFRDALYEHTEGHPLFTIELLRNLQEKEILVKDEDGRWQEKTSIDWTQIPARVEGVIEERIGRLDPDQREMLTIASVEGEKFTAQVISRILNLNERELLGVLSQSLGRKHSLILDRGVERVGQQVFSLFSFRHNLFQKYLYDQLSEPERLFLHKAVAEVLEELYLGHAEDIFPQLARHFALAGSVEKAVEYYTLAGKSAIKVSANHEAISHIQQALALLSNLPPSRARDQQELDLQLYLGPPLIAIKGWAAPELSKVYDRAQELCTEQMEDAHLVRGLWLLATYRLGRAEHEQVEILVERLSNLADRSKNPELLCLAELSVSPLYQGKLDKAREILEGVSRRYDAPQQLILAHRYGMAPSIVGKAYLSNCLWLLGFPEMAQSSIRQAFNWADEIDVPFTTCYVLGRSCWLHAQLNDLAATRAQAEKLSRISQAHGFRNFEPAAVFFLYWVDLMAGEGKGDEADRMYTALEEYGSMGTILNRTAFLLLYADTCTRLRRTRIALEAIEEAIALGEKTKEQWLQAEAYRLKGESLAQEIGEPPFDKSALAEIDHCFQQAYDIARSQHAKALELRAVISMVKWRKKSGQSDQALGMLKECYQSFDEGFNTSDLTEALALLTP